MKIVKAIFIPLYCEYTLLVSAYMCIWWISYFCDTVVL